MQPDHPGRPGVRGRADRPVPEQRPALLRPAETLVLDATLVATDNETYSDLPARGRRRPTRRSTMRRLLLFVAAVAMCLALAAPSALANPRPFRHIKHFVVIYLEDHSFDNMYGTFPGANGLANADPGTHRAERPGRATCSSALSRTTRTSPPRRCPPTRAARRMATHSTVISPTHRSGSTSTSHSIRPRWDLVHRYYQNQVQIDGGLNDKFVAASDAKGLAMVCTTRRTCRWRDTRGDTPWQTGSSKERSEARF